MQPSCKYAHADICIRLKNDKADEYEVNQCNLDRRMVKPGQQVAVWCKASLQSVKKYEAYLYRPIWVMK